MPELLTDEERLNRAVKSLRTMLRDKKELNRLLGNEYESSDEELKQAIIHSLLDFTLTAPPLGNYTLANHPNKFLLLQGAAIQALTSAGLWHSREHMPSSDGGTSADDHAKAGEYSGWINQYYQDYERKKTDLKLQMNLQAALGNQTLPSEYGYFHGEWW